MNSNTWSYKQHKHQETELFRRAQGERLASNTSLSDQTNAGANPVAAWVGEKLIEIGSRLTAEPAHSAADNYLFAENAR